MGMRPRRKATSTRPLSAAPGRNRPNLTSVPDGPFSNFITVLLVNPVPAMTLSSTATMRSPDWMPASALGPPGMGVTTMMVSS